MQIEKPASVDLIRLPTSSNTSHNTESSPRSLEQKDKGFTTPTESTVVTSPDPDQCQHHRVHI